MSPTLLRVLLLAFTVAVASPRVDGHAENDDEAFFVPLFVRDSWRCNGASLFQAQVATRAQCFHTCYALNHQSKGVHDCWGVEISRTRSAHNSNAAVALACSGIRSCDSLLHVSHDTAIFSEQSDSVVDVYQFNPFAFYADNVDLKALLPQMDQVNAHAMYAAQQGKRALAKQFLVWAALCVRVLELEHFHQTLAEKVGNNYEVSPSGSGQSISELYTMQYRSFTNLGVILQQAHPLPTKFTVQLYEYVCFACG